MTSRFLQTLDVMLQIPFKETWGDRKSIILSQFGCGWGGPWVPSSIHLFFFNYSLSFEAFPFSKSEKAMAPHSSTLAWKIPWTEEPGRLQTIGSLRVGHNWATSLSLFTFVHWRRKWQTTPVFLRGESQGWGSLVGCCLWGPTESDTTDVP